MNDIEECYENGLSKILKGFFDQFFGIGGAAFKADEIHYPDDAEMPLDKVAEKHGAYKV
jgi:hypothetical protein